MNTFAIREVALDSITKDGYQRDLYDSKVAEIVAAFDPAQWDLPKLTEKSPGEFRVIAGQHRVAAARALAESGAWPFDTPLGSIQAQVVLGITDTADEARLFLADAKNKKPLSPFDKHRASLVAEDRRALDVQDALDRLGIVLVRKQGAKNGQTLSAITAVYRLWDRGHGGRPNGGELVYETLRLASQRWDGSDIYRFDGLVLGGLGMVVQDYRYVPAKFSKLERLLGDGRGKLSARQLEGLAHQLSVRNGGVFSNTPMPYAQVLRERLAAKG